MTREEIISAERPIEPHCFETEREEQWYEVGLWEGANASTWHKVADGEPPEYNKEYLVSDGESIYIGFRDDYDKLWKEGTPGFCEIIDNVKYWMEIPELPTNEKK